MTTSPPTDPATSAAGHDPAPGPVPRGLAALSGMLAAAAGLGVGELLSAFSNRWPSPVVAVGDVVIANSPPAVTKWAIETFGTADKLVLIGGTLVVLALAAAGLGVLVQRRPGLALVGVAAFGAIAAFAVLAAPAGSVVAVLPVVGVTVVAAVSLLVLASGLANRPPPGLPAAAQRPLAPMSRRRFLTLATTVAVGAAATAAAGRTLVGTFDVEAARAELGLPGPVERVDLPLPDDVSFPEVQQRTPFITANEDFYRIDINLEIPRIDPATHQLRVIGMVERPLTIPFTELVQRDLVDIPITMTCVSYEIGGDLVDTAVWRGIRLRELLDEVGVADDADQIVGRSVDGYTCGFPLEAAYDRDAMVVVGMNDEPLPLEHGFPLRLITPGIYGYVGATKWLSEIEITRFDAFDQYWAPRGYDARAPIETMARIDTPSGLDRVEGGQELTIAGVAWAQTRGIERVEVRIDDGDWQEAELAPAVSDALWVPWRLRWSPDGEGQRTITARATDGTGTVQVEERTGVRPAGATGWHTLPVLVG